MKVQMNKQPEKIDAGCKEKGAVLIRILNIAVYLSEEHWAVQ